MAHSWTAHLLNAHLPWHTRFFAEISCAFQQHDPASLTSVISEAMHTNQEQLHSFYQPERSAILDAWHEANQRMRLCMVQ